MLRFIKQYKGKDIDKVPTKYLEDVYYAGIKYDGNYVQIVKEGNEVTFYTSSGKPFKLEDAAADIVRANIDIDFIIEAEYIANTDGLLGSRGKCTTTTYRTNTSKGIPNIAGTNKFMIFDILYLEIMKTVFYDCTIDDTNFGGRLNLLDNIGLTNNIELVEFTQIPLVRARVSTSAYCADGGEGYFLFHSSHTWRDKGRSNLAIKLKMKPRVQLDCIGIVEGEGKYIGMTGSLTLKDYEGRIVNVGSGLSDIDRNRDASYYIGKSILIEYEQILDTYIQPRFIKVVK